MDRPSDRPTGTRALLYVVLVGFVLAWIFGPYTLRSAIPIWLPFLIALGLELRFLVGAFRPIPAGRPDRGPQVSDRERYGYGEGAETTLFLPDEELEGELPEEDVELAPDFGTPGVRARVRRFILGLGVIGALALVVWAVESRSGWGGLDGEARAAAVARFSDEASRIAAKPVEILCDESRDYVGVVQHAEGVAAVGGNRAYLTPERCHDLYRLAFGGEVRSSRTARAIAVLAHEAWHLRGVRDEGTTECYALQSGVELGRRLGLSEDTARRLMRQQLVENALRGPASFEYRVPAECRDGGRLDLRPDDPRFP